jgi:nucleotide-binding universal stress UspA family protein
MAPIRTILVPVDFDAPSEAALEQAVRLARALGAKIKLLHVLRFALTDVDEVFYKSPNASVRRRTSALKRLADITERFSRDVPIESELREGIAWDEIVGAATQLEADLIVMGMRPRHGVARGFRGSVAERVIRAARVPVMTVHASSAEGRKEFATR